MTRICVPVCTRGVGEMREAIERAAEVADVIELRLDCLNDLNAASRITGQARISERPLILTLRCAEQGGQSSFDYDSRRRFWTSLIPPAADCFFDLEFDLVQDFSSAASFEADWKQVICSHHDFNGVPPDLEHVYEAMAATPAGIIKIAVQANDAIDCLPVFKLLERAQREGRELIAIAMGPAGIVTRVLGPSRGSFLTYGSLDDESATAPGQLTAKQLRDVYRIDRIDAETEVVGLVGDPISQSLSPCIHNAAFAAAELNGVYLPFQTRDVDQFIRRTAHPKTREVVWNLRGLSVTIPHKSSVMPLLDWIDPIAKQIGAVNTIVVRDDRLLGYNTDASGFMAPLLDRFGSVRNTRCAVIGAGGGARAALWSLNSEGASVVLFARNMERAAIAAEDFAVPCHQLSQADFAGFDIVVNATPLGMSGANQDLTPATAAQLHGVRLAYDLVYNPIETVFLREARAAGCDTLPGIEMFLAQGAGQFKLWTGKEPDPEVMRAAGLSRFAT
ncbi:MAG TPA: shikimate dehydrogenase [Pyrinomonadaceae bacterium]|nr:shikimate dehydrogenase [Pyrinomonadaceae bacterium]